MARTKITSERKRLQVMCSEEQEQKIKDAAGKLGLDVSAWCLAHLMKAAGSNALVLPQAIADRVIAQAHEQGITPDKLIEQWAIVSPGTETA